MTEGILTPQNIVLALLAIFAVIAVFSGFFTIHTKQAGLVERLGKFSHIAGPGLNFKVPFIDSLVYVEDLNMQLMDVSVQSKTKDDATVTIPIRVQYFVLADKVKEAYYELDDPEKQIKAHVENVILSYIPKLDLDDTYKQEDQIAARIKETLTTVMAKFGYCIENALVTKIVPADAVVTAMNEINAARREKIATEARAEAAKITLVKKAEAEAEAKALQGQGVARERKAIVDGLRDSVQDFEAGVKGIDAHDVMALVMMTQYFDALKDIGANSNTILLPHSPAAVAELSAQLRDAVTAGSLAAKGKQ
ncbi:MAG TPA: SPFH domain-containing protein [Bryobacteraceae bacterium]|nr:SPFH domain-containing protein [Bryobacteraceae bacterium]